MNKTRMLLLAAALVSVASITSASPVPQLRVAELVQNADVIVVGSVQAIGDLGPGSAVTPSGPLIGRRLVATLVIDRVLKGQNRSSLEFIFVRSDTSGAYGGIAAGDYRVFFLKGSGDPYELVSPYYPSLVAIRGSTTTAETALDRVCEVLAEVLNSPSESLGSRQSAISALWGVKSRFAADGLASALGDDTPAIRFGAASSLLASGDLRALSVADPALMSSGPTVPSDLLHNLIVAIDGLKDLDAIPELDRLLTSPNVETRRRAVRALRFSAATPALDSLAKALDDADNEVRYEAVAGLAGIAGQPQWGPSIPEFNNNPTRYIEHWKAWRGRRQ
jgi:hypothetical protein